jgi:hypothetical protein
MASTGILTTPALARKSHPLVPWNEFRLPGTANVENHLSIKPYYWQAGTGVQKVQSGATPVQNGVTEYKTLCCKDGNGLKEGPRVRSKGDSR